MITLIKCLVLLGSLFASSAFAVGPGGGGYDHGNGGDMCEYRFSVIRDDLKSWIVKGGAARLKLPAQVTVEHYVQTMLEKILTAKVSCVQETLSIGTAEKTCINYTATDGSLQIQCQRELFLATKDSDQYVLVHHEYAGLAGFEVNAAETSRYEISDQIAAYLEDKIIKKLAVRPANSELKNPFEAGICQGAPLTSSQAEKLIEDGVRSEVSSQAVAVSRFTLYMRERLCRADKGCQPWNIIKNQMPHPNVFGSEIVMQIPTGGIVTMANSGGQGIEINLLSTERGLVGQGAHLTCRDQGLANVQCAVSALPTLSDLGTASGIVTSECAAINYRYSLPVNILPGPGNRIDFTVGPVSGNAWVEREAVFFSRFK